MDTMIYEGAEPYVFISYSHKDIQEMREVAAVLWRNGVRFWYDDGLHSGDDWNYSIATHLKNCSVCLLLLSPNSASSDYVKNELNFAMNHRIPIHTLLLRSFEIPLDIELMTGRVQMLEMNDGYTAKLLNAIPVEVFRQESGAAAQSEESYVHPLFEQGKEYLNLQGTKTYQGKHRSLGYPCAVQTDILRSGTEKEVNALISWVGGINHPLFPRLYDVVIRNGVIRTYQEYGNEVFLHEYLKEHRLSEKQIREWILLVVDGMEYLFHRKLTMRDFARGSIAVAEGERICLFRLHHVHYGLIRITEETKQYYFDNALREIAVLLAQLCTCNIPLLPLRIVEEKAYSNAFLDVVNLVIQKCSREYGRTQYYSFSQIKQDLAKQRITFGEKRFLKTRREKLKQYEAAQKQRKETFTFTDGPVMPVKLAPVTQTLEEQFGFDETVVLQDHSQRSATAGNPDKAVQIRVMECSTGSLFEFEKSSIIIGRDASCDIRWEQRYVSRRSVTVTRRGENVYAVTEMNTANGAQVSYTKDGKTYENLQIPAGGSVEVPIGAVIIIGGAQFRLMPLS